MHKRGLILMAAVFVVALLAAVPARAQFGAIEGDVKGADGKPVQNAQILIERTDIKGTYKTKSDKKGHYFHGGLPLGTYNISLFEPDQKMEGRPRDFVRGVRVRLGDPTPVHFDLKAAADRAAAAAAGVQLTPGKAGTQEAPQLTKEQRAQIEAEQKKRAAERERFEKLNKSFAAGMEALKVKNYDTAITELEAAAQTDPTQHVVFANLGEAYLGAARAKRGEEAKALLDKSIVAYEKAITLKADDASYYNNFALAQAQAGKIAEAQDSLAKAAALDPTNAGKYYFNLGAVLVNSGKAKESAEAFRKATQADPNYAEAWYQLGVALSGDAKLDEKTGKITAAPGTIEALQKYVELAPNGPNAEAAKSLAQTLGGSVQTQIKAEKASKKR